MHVLEKNMKQVTLILVEDDDIDARGIERGLKSLKIANPVLRARDGIEALDLLRGEDWEGRPYIILLDLNMPRMNGIEFLQEIRKDPELEQSVVFVLTTSRADNDKVNAYKNHVAGYIVKTQMKNNFIDVIKMLDYYWRIVELP